MIRGEFVKCPRVIGDSPWTLVDVRHNHTIRGGVDGYGTLRVSGGWGLSMPLYLMYNIINGEPSTLIG